MKVLVVGSGGREHALVWKLAQSPLLTQLYCAPGNAGTLKQAENVPIGAADVAGLVAFAKENSIDLTVVGPEAPLIAGLADRLEEAGLRVFGARAACAQLEGSKAFAKDLMRRVGAPTAEFQTFTDPDAAADYARARWAQGRKLVVKASGEALGKGAIVTDTLQDALDAISMLMVERALGPAGETVVVEDRLEGWEASLMAFCAGDQAAMLPAAQDFKRALDGHRGPNTGGMGSYTPMAGVGAERLAEVRERVVLPTIRALAEAGNPYKGVLYPGILYDHEQPYTLEFNCRFGDPETQCLMPALESDLLAIALGVAEGRLDADAIEWSDRAVVCVVMASGGYPGDYEKGKEITGLEEAEQVEGVTVFHAGTKLEGGRVVTAGGRVLGVTAVGDTVAEARARAYAACERIRFDGAFYRRDIAAGV